MKKLSILILLVIASVGYGQNTVKFTAKITDRLSDTIQIRAKGFKHVMPVGKDGVFTGSFEAPAGMYQFFDGSESTMLYLKPGYDLTMNMDTKQWDESIVYSGKGAAENNYLAQKALLEEAFYAKMEGVRDEAMWLTAINENTATLLKGLEVPNIDPDFKALTTKFINNDAQYAIADVKDMIATQKLVGTDSPSFKYENYKGGTTSLEDLRGKYVYIDVWATWCGPCRQEIPHLKRIEKKYHGKKIEFVSMSIDNLGDHDKWKKFVAEKELGGIQLFADNAWESQFVTDYKIKGIPRFILVDPQGKVVTADAPRPSHAQLETMLDDLLK